MATKKTKTVTETTTSAVEKAADDSVRVMEKTKENIKNIDVSTLHDSDEIEVISLVPRVSYKDNHTGDMYEWEEVGHSEFMPFEVIKNMWRNSKGYFKNLWLKPLDERVLEKLKIASGYEKYEFLMDAKNYTKANIKEICDIISETPNALKISIVNKIKMLIMSGEVTDISVIRPIEKMFDLDLISFLE